MGSSQIADFLRYREDDITSRSSWEAYHQFDSFPDSATVCRRLHERWTPLFLSAAWTPADGGDSLDALHEASRTVFQELAAFVQALCIAGALAGSDAQVVQRVWREWAQVLQRFVPDSDPVESLELDWGGA